MVLINGVDNIVVKPVRRVIFIKKHFLWLSFLYAYHCRSGVSKHSLINFPIKMYAYFFFKCDYLWYFLQPIAIQNSWCLGNRWRNWITVLVMIWLMHVTSVAISFVQCFLISSVSFGSPIQTPLRSVRCLETCHGYTIWMGMLALFDILKSNA